MTDEVITDYIAESDWRTKENSNDGRSISGLKSHVVGSSLAKHALNKAVGKHEHIAGKIHIHDLRGSIYSSYCCGHDLRELLLQGIGIESGVQSRPAKHLDVVVDHIGNYLQILSNEWEGAQAFSSVDSYLAPFIFADKLNQTEVNQQMERLVYGLNFESRAGFQCVTEDTEVLTPNGFKTHDALQKGDDIYTWNNGELNIQEVLNVHVKDYDGEMHVYSSRDITQTVTPNHRVLRKAYNSDEYMLSESSKLINRKSPLPIPVSMLSNNTPEFPISDALLKMVVATLTDGHIKNGNKIVISKSPNRFGNELICDSLDTLGLEYTHSIKDSNFGEYINVYGITIESSKRILEVINNSRDEVPFWFTELSARQAKIVIDTWAAFDGTCADDRQRLQCDNESIADSIQQVCFLAGNSSRKHYRHFKANADNPATINEYDVLYVSVYKSNTKWLDNNYTIKYKGKVWCPSTDDGVVVYRKDGRIFISGNSPFTNLSFDWTVQDDMKDVQCIVGGVLMGYTYGDMQPYMDMVNIGFLKTLINGDSNGKVFTFPIPTYSVRDISMFIDTDQKTELLWKLTSKFGSPYFSNYLGSGINPNTIRSMCCRLQLDTEEIAEATSGIWDKGVKTGSLAIVSINLNRIALESNDLNEYMSNLEDMVCISTEQLLQRKEYILHAFDNGLMPYTKKYVQRLNTFFLTIGIVGAHEAYINMDGINETYSEFATKIVSTVKRILKLNSTTTGHKLWNVEQTPAEGTAYRFAKADIKAYPNGYVSGSGDDIYLTNSTHLPVDNDWNIIDEIEFRAECDRGYTGGTLFNYYANEYASPESVKELIHKMCVNTKLPYIAYTPTFGVCEEHGVTYGSSECSTCGKEIDVYTRVVGYIRPTDKFNIGQLQQFKNRKYFDSNEVNYD